jgi:Zn-dependent peptidase ImmA (M78 family)
MGSANLAHVNPEIIRWARARIGLSPEELASKQVRAESIRSWEQKLSLPTHAQAEALAAKLRLPYLVLFLSEPPEMDVPIPDLRTVSGSTPNKLSIDFAEVINDILVRQDWYRELQINAGSKELPFVGRFDQHSPVSEIAADIRNTIGLSSEFRRQCANNDALLRGLIESVEENGILVFRSALVRHATKRKLKVQEFRGFVVTDHYAPAIFINDADARAAQIFTLAHELAHIWTGITGIADVDLKRRPSEFLNDGEVFCNKIAAEVLVPEAEFQPLWSNTKSLKENIRTIVSEYRVSTLVALRRAYELGRIDYKQFSSEFDEQYRLYREREKKEDANELKLLKKKKSGGNFWASFEIRNSRRFTEFVIAEVKSGRTRYTDAATLLGVKTPTVERFVSRTRAPK